MITLQDRPFRFDDMIGQKGILKEMKKRSIDCDFPPVMIFEGPSGTGKTTLACIIAALLSDKNPIVNSDGTKDPNPESPACKAIRETKFNRDVVFKDGSKMGKEDIAELENSLMLAPRFDGKKVIVIDEAQALSKVAKGATLTLLEKQRKDTHIILCTMDIDAFDKAVRSRGPNYKFRSPSSTEIAEYLLDYTEKLDLPVDESMEEFYTKGLFTIAENCGGSVRTALQNFERCVQGEFFTVEEIEREFGIMSNDKLSDLIESLCRKDSDAVRLIRDFGAKEFHYKLLKVLSDAYVYKTAQYIDQQWKIRTADRLSDALGNRLETIVENMSKVDAMGYFREEIFFFQLAKSFYPNRVDVEALQPKVIPTPNYRVSTMLYDEQPKQSTRVKV